MTGGVVVCGFEATPTWIVEVKTFVLPSESLSPCFFFSSRRRHTRYWRDWSSDVCSSDLAAEVQPVDGAIGGGDEAVEAAGGAVGDGSHAILLAAGAGGHSARGHRALY